MRKSAKDLILIGLSVIFVNFLIWLPHILALPQVWGLSFKEGFSTIYRNFDGLEYVIIAKTWYQGTLMAALPQSAPAGYFASHFPGYSILIYLFAPLLGFLKSMLFVATLFTAFSAISFYFLLKDFNLTKQPLFLTLIFLILPARWLIVHSVGSSEPMFIFFTITSLYFFLKYERGKFIHLHLKEPLQKRSHLILAGLFGLFAQLTRPPGILLFIALAVYLIFKYRQSLKFSLYSNYKKAFIKLVNYFPLLLIPIGLLGMFYFYKLSYGDFFAYFHSGDNIHLTFPPFQVFNKGQLWVGEAWLEDIVYILILGFLGAVTLFKQKLYPLAFFVLTYLIASTLVVHRDISRYVLPIAPFVLIAFEKVLVSKEFKIVLAIVAVGIYLYAQNFILANVAPYPNLQLFN